MAYVYKWTHLPTMMWYVGSRARKNCHPDDGYICSSKVVKLSIINNPNDWKREIIATGEKSDMRELETIILQTSDARKDNRSFNSHNNDYLTYSANNGSQNPMYGKNHTIESKEKMSISGSGKTRSEEARLNISKGHIGVSNGPHTQQTKEKMSIAMKGRPSPKKSIKIVSDKKHYHNGSISKKFIPGTEPMGFVPGRIISKRKLVATELNVHLNKGKA